MHIDIGITQILAIYGAVISSITVGWNLYRDLHNRPKLKVSASLRMMATRTDGKQYAVSLNLHVRKASQKIFVEIHAVNIRRPPVSVEYCAGKYRKPIDGDRAFIISPVNFPKMLQQHEYISDFYDDPYLVNNNVSTLCVVDSTQKAWKVSKHNLKRLRKEATKFGFGCTEQSK